MNRILLLVFMCALLAGCTEFKEFVRKLPRWETGARGPLSADRQDDKQIYTGEVMGAMENILILGENLPPLKAKLDPNVRTTTLDVEITGITSQDKKEFVSYRVRSENDSIRELQKEIVRWDTVRKEGKETVRRPVVIMELCIGNKKINGEVALSNKEYFLYPILVGENILKNRIIVDPSKTFTVSPSC